MFTVCNTWCAAGRAALHMLWCVSYCLLSPCSACRFPWWPAVVVSDSPSAAAAAAAVESHSSASSSSTDGGRGPNSVLVRFLGTYDAAWVEPRAVLRWGVAHAERAAKTKAAAFVKALKEAAQYLETGAHGAIGGSNVYAQLVGC